MKKLKLSSFFLLIFLTLNHPMLWGQKPRVSFSQATSGEKIQEQIPQEIAIEEKNPCHLGFSKEIRAKQAQKKALQKIDAKKYKIVVERFEGEKIAHWHLVVQPADSSVQNQVDEISRGLGATESCGRSLQEVVEKPVIYLYPSRPTDVLVQLDLRGDFVFTHPAYDESISGWSVTAYPDGHLLNHADKEEYSYLFWEGKNLQSSFDLSTGFVVPGNQSRDFLRSTLKKMGLTAKEYNEFLVYWVPRMQDNPYNLIHFAGEEYTQAAPLQITPKPDSMLRVFMVFQALPKPISIPEQKIVPFERKGFSVVEWGGIEL